ncbi:MAG TPA: hypothetical protein VFA16_21885 [Mycobacterium sp.]|uniref:hypothetical protein n=1 Tax=Mycobacterium sp. TaxID=1785 RepID=UPI002D4A1F28|nr:hypothetical protein [Mycobacterium sp.]HZU49879.1 hypothetical protein [Mycobacterium sp.]
MPSNQQQRVALVRALAIRSKVILLDEPFSSLDASLRDTVRRAVSRVLHKLRQGQNFARRRSGRPCPLCTRCHYRPQQQVSSASGVAGSAAVWLGV